MHWFVHTAGLAGELNSIGWVNVDPAHGWEAGEVHRVRLVRPRHGATCLGRPQRRGARGAGRGDRAVVGAGGLLGRAAARGGHRRQGDGERRVGGHHHSGGRDVRAGRDDGADARQLCCARGRRKNDGSELGSGLFGTTNRPIFAPDDVDVPFTFPPEDPDEIEYWSATLRAAQAIVTTDRRNRRPRNSADSSNPAGPA